MKPVEAAAQPAHGGIADFGEGQEGHAIKKSQTPGPTLLQLACAALLLVLAFDVMLKPYVGFQAGDDKSYLAGALGWLQSFPYVGDNHWTLRHTITIPVAFAISVLGLNEFAVSLPSLAYFAAFLGLNAWMLRRHLGETTAVLATMLVLILPGFVVLATYLDIDVPELLFVSLSFWLFREALEAPRRSALWVASGASLGLAFITRETAASLGLFYALLFVFRPLAPRRGYWLQFAGFAPVLALDWSYLTALTGNPVYRYMLDFNHDKVDRFLFLARVASRNGLIDSEGNISVNVFLDPLLNIFISQKYGLLFWLLVPAAILVWRRRRDPATLTLSLLLGLGLTSFLFIALNPRLYLVPRYFLVFAWTASVLVAWWLTRLWSSDKRRHVLPLLALLLGTSAVALAVENTNPRFVERQLVSWAAAHPGKTVYTDVETLARTRAFLRFAGVPATRVSDAPAPAGAVFYYSPQHIDQCRISRRCMERVREFEPHADWAVLQRIEPAPLPLGRMLQRAGLDRHLPEDIRRRLLTPGGTAIIYLKGEHA